MIDLNRRSMMEGSAAAALAAVIAAPAGAAIPAPSTAPPNGGDFAFLTGEWRIANKRKKDGAWDEFPGEATVHALLGGIASIEELRIPARRFFGMGVRVYHLKDKKWADHWTSAGNGVVNEPLVGSFVNGEGIFPSEEKIDGKTVQYLSKWDRITATSCRWRQGASRDGGASWDWDWVMDWTRVTA
jgi:hypothetical protein